MGCSGFNFKKNKKIFLTELFNIQIQNNQQLIAGTWEREEGGSLLLRKIKMKK